MTATTITEVIDQLTEIIARSCAENRREGYFAALYRKVTIAVYDKIKAGYFDDNDRMEKLDVVFANRYLEAYHCYRGKKACSASWKVAFDSGSNWRPMVMHHLLTGMNAHIALDLGIATAIVSPGTGIMDIQKDFNKINTVLCELITEVKADLYSMWPLSKLISKLNMGKLENDIAGFSMNIARDAAWQVALAYAADPGVLAQQNYLATRDTSVANFGNRLLNPGKFVYALTGIFRVFEFGSIPNKIKRLE